MSVRVWEITIYWTDGKKTVQELYSRKIVEKRAEFLASFPKVASVYVKGKKVA